MKNTLKIAIFFAIMIAVLLVVPSICNAAEINVPSEETETLYDAVAKASDGDTINITEDITLEKAVEVSGKSITINGNHNTITADTNMAAADSSSSNKSMLTAVNAGAKITLKDVNLTGSPKYGVQAYNGGEVTLDGVNIYDCNFGGVLNNCGIVEIVDLTLGHNGKAESNNGIELGKGSAVTVEEPTLIMNGTLASDQTENVIYIAEDEADKISSFTVKNIYDDQSGEKDRLYVDKNGNKIIVTDSKNNLKFESNATDKVSSVGGDIYIPNPTVTIEVPNMPSISFEIPVGGTLTKEQLESKIDLSGTNLVIDGFFTDEEFKDEFDFRGEIQSNITLYTKLSEAPETVDPENPSDEENKPAEDEKDDTPKTGVSSYIGIAGAIAVISLATIVVIKKKNA